MKSAVVATGSELINGLVQDSNSKFLAEKISSLGIEVENILICGDQKENIKNTIAMASQKADLIFITGGLGPTEDDLTKKAFAELMNLRLIYSKEIENKLKNIFCNYNSEMSSNNLSQAYIPEGAEVIDNQKGTAPALKIKIDNKIFYLLPGVPKELKCIFKNKILDDLKKTGKDQILIKEFNFIGIGESTLASKVSDLNLSSEIKVSYQAGKAEVKLRLKIDQKSKFDLREKKVILKKAVNIIRSEFSDFIYGEDQQSILQKVHDLLISKKLSIAAAESFTGGLIAERLTEKAGSSQYFLGSIVAYNEKFKRKILHIAPKILDKYGVVSKECVQAMVKNAAEIFKSDITAATTGAAGPGGHDGQKAGTMFVALSYQGTERIIKFNKNYGREMNRYYASQIVLFEIYKLIKESGENLNV
ncbi:MAG: competence/damage-inducible protein A [Halanaerobium sp.]